jgi:hypothetical protein
VQIQDLQHKMLGVLQIGHADKLPAKNGKSNLLRKYIDCCFFKILSCHSVYLSYAILSRRSFVAALFCRGALLSLRSFVAALILRLSFVARSFVARSNVVDSLSMPLCGSGKTLGRWFGVQVLEEGGCRTWNRTRRPRTITEICACP